MRAANETASADVGKLGPESARGKVLLTSPDARIKSPDIQAKLFGTAEVEPTRNGRIQAASALRKRVDVEYRPLPCRTLLNENRSPSMPFSWTINPYRGCEFACRYCYARATHAYLDHDPKDFEKRIYVKRNAAEVLAKTLRPELLLGKNVTIGTATDPYQGAERHFQVTRGILQVLARTPGLSLSITTKSPLVLRDIDVIREIARHSRIRINISMTTLRPGLAHILEPRAPRPPRRIETIRRLAVAGIDTALFCMPILPGITDRMEDLQAVVTAAKDAGAHYAFGGTLHLEAPIRPTFLPMLRRHFPRLYGHYQDLYANGRYAPKQEQERIERLFAIVRDRAGFPATTERAVGNEDGIAAGGNAAAGNLDPAQIRLFA